MLIGRPGLNAFGAALSTAHLILKFPTPTGIASVKGDVKAARQCYLTSVKTGLRGEGCSMVASSRIQTQTRDKANIGLSPKIQNTCGDPGAACQMDVPIDLESGGRRRISTGRDIGARTSEVTGAGAEDRPAQNNELLAKAQSHPASPIWKEKGRTEEREGAPPEPPAREAKAGEDQETVLPFDQPNP